MAATADTKFIPWDITDVAERLDGASRDALVALLSATIDRLYFLRGQAAYAANLLTSALDFKGFATSRRAFGIAQVDLLVRMAKGDAEDVKFDRQTHRVERAAVTAGIPTWIPDTLPTGIDTTGPKGENEPLRLGIGYALRELLALRQLSVYEARVARAHDIPSGPKGVRALLESIERTLLLAEAADITDLPDELRQINRRAALTAVGADHNVTNHAYLATHGLEMA